MLFNITEIHTFFSICPIFVVSKMASAGPNHLTAEEVFQSVCYPSRFTHRICDFSRCFISNIVVVVVGEGCRSSSFCKHTTSTRRVPYSVSHILAHAVNMKRIERWHLCECGMPFPCGLPIVVRLCVAPS